MELAEVMGRPNRTLQPPAATNHSARLKGLILAAAAERWRQAANPSAF